MPNNPQTAENHEKAMEAERVRQQPGMTAPTTRTSVDDDKDYLRRMEAESAEEIAAKIVHWITSKEEDGYYAVKYGRRMIEALVNVTCHEKGCIY